MAEQVTVLIPFYNPGQYLIRAVKSVINQTEKNWRLILIDDASTDNTRAKLRKFLSDPRISLLRIPVNVGQSQALNLGLQHVTTPFLVELDADDWFSPLTLETLLKAALAAPKDVGVFYANFTYVYENIKGKVYKKSKEKGRPFLDKYDFLVYNRTVRPRFYRTSTLRAIGGFSTNDPYGGRYVQDRLVLLRLIEGCRFHWVDAKLYYYRQHRSNKTRNKERMREMIEWAIRDALHRWGDGYAPVFVTDESGLPRFQKLVALEPQRQESGDSPRQL